MYGFYIHTKYRENEEKQYENHIVFKDFLFGYISFNKFENDKIFQENQEYIIGVDGVILNRKNLLNNKAATSFFNLIILLYKKDKIDFVSSFKGEFSGFIFEKTTKKLQYFNNKTATKQIFYSQFDNRLIIAPRVEAIVKSRKKSNISNKLNINSSYHLLTFGGMIENNTLIQDIYKLGAGEYLSFDNNKLSVNRYFDFNDIPYSITDKSVAIKRINEVFITALELEYEKDKEYNYNSLATLSGGLDSRMNVMLADIHGYKPEVFCFSQSGYLDETIARKIANDQGLDFQFIPLDGGEYLKSLTEMVDINSGLQFYNGSAHYNYALKQIDISNKGLIHTGQIGDGILGGFVTPGKHKDFLSKTISNRFSHKTVVEQSVLNTYRDEETYKLYQRVFNLANYGSYMVEQHKTYLVSPFLDDDVIAVALSIHPDLKQNQDIYIDWINELHPEITKYKWERTGFKPNKKWKTAFSRYTNKLKKEYFIFTKQEQKCSMNPIDYWYRTNKSIFDFYNSFYKENLVLLSQHTALFIDVQTMFNQGNLTEKALVLTLLEVVRKYKLEV